MAVGVFAGLDGAQLDGVIAALERDAAADPPYARSLGELRGLGLTPEQSRNVMRWLYELRIGTLNPELMTGILNSVEMDGDEKGALLGVFRRMLKSKTLALGDGQRPLIQYGAPAEPTEVITMPDGSIIKTGGDEKSQIPPLSRNAVNIKAFSKFVSEHKDDPEFKDKYVAIVNGKYQKTGTSKASLVQDMYDKFGYVKMYVGKVTTKQRMVYVGSPKRI